jgi:iron complex transport system substrate-binding protein
LNANTGLLVLSIELMKQRATLVATLIVVTLLLVGCANEYSSTQSNSGNSAEKKSVIPMKVVTDDLGRSISIPVKINRVVSLAPSITESIFAVGGGERLVGVTSYCNYPEAAQSIAKVGDTQNPNIERIIALQPDLVFVTTASQIEAFASMLEENRINVYVSNPNSLSAVYKDLAKLAIIFGTDPQAGAIIRDLEERELAVRSRLRTYPVPDETQEEYDERVSPRRVFLQISKEPLFTVGKDTFLNDIIMAAGGRSVTRDVPTSFPKLSKETASTLNPEVIILSDSDDNQQPNDVFKNSPAVKNGRVYKINADIISRPGPRLVDAIEQIAGFLHGEKN